MANIQVDVDKETIALLDIENERRGGRAKREIIEEAIQFYLEDLGTLKQSINDDIESLINLEVRLIIEKDKQLERTKPIVKEPTNVEKMIEERRQRMAREQELGE